MDAFDHFIIVDWSARNAPSPKKPTKDAIWVAQGKSDVLSDQGKRNPIYTRYYRTRYSAYVAIKRRLFDLSRRGQKVLLGCDFSFSYPKGLAKALRLSGAPWQAIWKEWHRIIEDDVNNRNNRFQMASDLNRRLGLSLGPFWGAPKGESGIFLGSTKDFSYPVRLRKGVELHEKRIVESAHRQLQSSWKLAYIGSVGSQSLLGIPYLYDLRFMNPKLKGKVRVWPFETGLEYPQEGEVVVAEIWPSLIERPMKDDIPDREQVKTYIKWLRLAQQNGELADYFSGPKKSTARDRKQIVKHEGWILGIR